MMFEPGQGNTTTLKRQRGKSVLAFECLRERQGQEITWQLRPEVPVRNLYG